jgi:16S rRNA (cytosine967-C5)-methyltransferase
LSGAISKTAGSDPARVATATLEAMLGVESGQYADRALNEAGRRFRLQAEDRLDVKRWLYRTLRWRSRFDAVLADSGELWREPETLVAGRLALAANFEAPTRPELVRALASELSERGKKRAAAQLAGLPPLARQTPLAVAGREPAALAAAYSHPEWMVEILLREFGADAVALLEANNAEPPTMLRTNTLRTTRDELAAKLAAEGVATAPGRFSPAALLVTSASDVFRTAAFREGLFELQDEASQLIAWVVDPKPRGLVIDACAGAGGKSLALAAHMKNRGRILAIDIYESKLERLRERAGRAGVDNVETRLVEAGGLGADLVEKADAVLVDAPCTGLGVLRRNPDAKWRLKAGDSQDLAARQFGILLSWSQAVKPGGLLVYSTCSLQRAENADVIAAFVKAQPGFTVEPATVKLPAEAARFATPEGFFQSLPHRDGTDGFFAARLRKNP